MLTLSWISDMPNFSVIHPKQGVFLELSTNKWGFWDEEISDGLVGFSSSEQATIAQARYQNLTPSTDTVIKIETDIDFLKGDV